MIACRLGGFQNTRCLSIILPFSPNRHKIVHHIHKMGYFVLHETSSILGHNPALFEDFVKH